MPKGCKDCIMLIDEWCTPGIFLVEYEAIESNYRDERCPLHELPVLFHEPLGTEYVPFEGVPIG